MRDKASGKDIALEIKRRLVPARIAKLTGEAIPVNRGFVVSPVVCAIHVIKQVAGTTHRPWAVEGE